MTETLGPIPTERRSGEEAFHAEGAPIGGTLREFWQWSGSNLLGNTERGILAEYLVAKDLGLHADVQQSWLPFDLQTSSGIRVEVKSGAYIQDWMQTAYSRIVFGIRPTFAWDPKTNEFEGVRRRQSDVYVFAVLVTRDQSQIDPMDVSQWEFFVLPTKTLNQVVGDQKSITLSRVRKLGATPVPFGQISGAIERALESTGSQLGCS